MVANKKKTEAEPIQVPTLQNETIEIQIVGKTPLIMNSMSAKTKQGLLTGGRKKTAVEKATQIKHNPQEEFVSACYRHTEEDDRATRLMFPASAFKKAMANAALDLPGTKKTEIGRLSWVEGYSIDIYGIPKLVMSVMRSSDINRTPDVRTRAILGYWCCTIQVSYVCPNLNATSIINLINAAGLIQGIGDSRNEKGKGTNGQFYIVSPDDKEAMKLVKTLRKAGGRVAQDEALANPMAFDTETASLLEWHASEVARRGIAV